jgi:Domain of unknown function (DUF1707)/Cell wall-active antibiotics response 4TMS YvqF
VSRTPELRASDSDRERVADALREHSVAGRLTLDELSDRLDAAYGAKTQAELEELTRDLPGVATPTTPSRREPTRWSVAVMGSTERTSRWRIARETTAVAVMGSVVLDLRKAELEGDEVEITAVALMGSIEILVPPGIEVDVTGFAFMGSREEKVADVPRLPGTPLVRVRANACMGSVEIRSKPSGRPRGHISHPRLPPPH